MKQIESERLLLKTMSLPLLRLILEENIEKAQNISDFIIPSDCSFPNGIWLRRRMKMIDLDGEQHKWMYRAIIRKKDNKMVGHISFHHKAPDPDLSEIAELSAELGYTINTDCRRNGYAKESAIAMMKWANTEANVNTFILTISPENIASIKLAKSMRFYIIGERTDETDGLEYIMRGELEDIIKTESAYQII